ncbi:hypothetical protein JOE61_002338 [Nocardioides salarius]|uniref:MotA/TolQ/ExbB proton channel domain-containing protein n=1 Tax=Nocardioides salarius TaxID=374513 RepID=A0ABS2MBG2_9ACTN|nr:hypothetical protein [Nocardioides salarius]MBM7508524.1 hypothetical protein [Nocardioides salarius]
MTRNFYDGKSIERPRTHMSRSVEAHYNPPKRLQATEEGPKGTLRERFATSLRNVVVPIALAVCPGLFCASLGMMIGTFTWLAQQDPDRLEAVSIQPLGAISFVSFIVLGPAVLYLVTDVEHEVRLHALPTLHPASTLDVTRSKRR